MAHTRWVASTPRECRCRKASAGGGQRLWKSRSVETPKQGSHGAWKSRKERGIPTFPQPRRRRASNMYWKADTSRVTKTGHLHVLTTEGNSRFSNAFRLLPYHSCPHIT